MKQRARIWHLLRQRKIKQIDLAEMLDINPIRVCQLCTMSVTPTLEEIKKLTKKLNASEAELFTPIFIEDFRGKRKANNE